MLINFNSGHDQEAKNLYKNSFSSPPETPPVSGIRGNNALISFRKAGHAVPTPFPVRVNCSVTIVATQSLQIGAISDNFQLYVLISFVGVSTATIVIVFFFCFFSRMAVSAFLSNVTSKFEILKI